TAITYDLLTWQERQNTDDKTIGDLFYLMNESLPDIRFVDALVYLISELKELKQNSFEKIDEVINDFINQLPRFIQIALKQII
ncbi:IS4 family transposase, partial [Bifidobacterium breve]|nr:IS4 family transposase [Bifidobacterium breve]